MRFSLSTFFVAALAALASAQSPDGPNPFSIPASGLSFTAGTPATISWKPTTSGTVTILLRQGPSGSLGQGTPIAKNIPNSGSISWTPPPDTVKGSDYALEIVDDTNPTNTNFTPQFSIDSTNTVSKAATTATTTAASTTAATTTSASASTTSSASNNSTSSSATSKTTAATSTAAGTTTKAPSSSPSAGAAAPVVKVSGGLVLMALGMLAL